MANGERLGYIRYLLFATRYPPLADMSDPAHALTLQFLAWVAESPRTYAQAMDAWRSTCPRLSIWEDAILDGLVGFAGGATRNRSRVVLTPKGRTHLRAGVPVAAKRAAGKLRVATVPRRAAALVR
jgi:hypothetical protein